MRRMHDCVTVAVNDVRHRTVAHRSIPSSLHFHSFASTSRCTYLARRSVSRFTLPPGCKRAERGHGQRVGDQGDAEAVGLAGDDRQAHAVDGDRAFRGHLHGQLAGHGEPEGGPVAAVVALQAACPRRRCVR